MGTRRITYTSALIGLALFYILYSHWFSWYLLVLFLLLIPFDLAFSLPGMLTRRITIIAPNVLEQGSHGILAIVAYKKKPFPARCIKAWLKIYNDDFKTMRRFVCGAERGNRYEVEIDTSRSGLTVFEIKRIWIVSLIGLFSMPATVNCRSTVLVLSAPARPANIIALSRGVILRPKPGGGFSEEHDLRHYRSGDPIRSIHWKLSAKFDSLIIREPLVQPPHSRLIIIESWNGAQERDVILGRLRWVSDYLLKWDMPYFIRFGDDGSIEEITKAEDLIDFLRRSLDVKKLTLPAYGSVPTRFSWIFRVNAGG
ncbi:MAG: DUF58 domain-containing protein [Oscillospiraceae bacterium]|nr:DUF58 domain-containing protein [Oscillospiraceae bacterium]